MKLKSYLSNDINKLEMLDEAEYSGMMYFHEMVLFYQQATDKEIEELEKALKKDDFKEFRRILTKKGLLKNVKD